MRATRHVAIAIRRADGAAVARGRGIAPGWRAAARA